MSRLAREHPEDDRYQSLEGQREILTAKHDLMDFEGQYKAIRDRVEEEFEKSGPSADERVNQGRGYDD